MGFGGTSPHTLNFGTIAEWPDSRSCHLPPSKQTPVSIVLAACEPKNQPERGVEEINACPY
jgi:hypothetical protein